MKRNLVIFTLYLGIFLFLDSIGIFSLLSSFLRSAVIIPTANTHITDIVVGSPAANVDLRIGDEVISLNGNPIDNEFYRGGDRPLSETSLEVNRDGRLHRITFREGEYENELGGRLGVVIGRNKAVSPFDAEALRYHFSSQFRATNFLGQTSQRAVAAAWIQRIELVLALMLIAFSLFPSKRKHT